MDKDTIIFKVIKKLSNLNKKYIKDIPKLVDQIKKTSSKNLFLLLSNYKDTYRLSDQEYSLLLESLIERYQVHLISKEHKKELKKITETRPISTYFDLLY